MLPLSERMRTIVYKAATVAMTGVEHGVTQMLTNYGHAEIRMVDGSEFDHVISKSGRLVIVDFHYEETMVLKNDKSDLDKSISRLSSEVLVAKVLADRNVELIDRLQIQTIPTIRVYRDGELLEEFKGKVDNDQFLKTVQYHLDTPNSQPYYNGYIGPLKKDWLPEGIEETASGQSFRPLNADSH